MNKQRKVLITITYNEMGIIIDTKAEEVAQPNLQPTCNQLATDTISRQAAIDALGKDPGFKVKLLGKSYDEGRSDQWFKDVHVLTTLPSAQPQIIRCKDCKHRDKYGCCKYWKGLAMADIPIATDDNDFCSYAEQKGEQCERKL